MEGSPDGGGDGQNHAAKSSPATGVSKGKSCKGCLYYSSVLKSNGRNPRCFGISRTLPQVPLHIVGESEMEANNEGRNLSDFKYACTGYSVFLDNTNNPDVKGENRAELPFCAGIELLVDRRASNSTRVPAHVHNKEDGVIRSQPQPHKPAHSTIDDFYTRFARNAGLVASGVAKNLNKVGTCIKNTVDDMMYPYRRPPK
ncbi:uncharacterized protein LOC109822054 [Asparagus officinalis]|uniref:uncharacterized protein LOC109822054 n=1 Tax=Asparagus officinalis TaxID=4686 RepID=UPI00098DE67F|nr:uncharacterized protein LOC109822054 [Asparagus officinalis]